MQFRYNFSAPVATIMRPKLAHDIVARRDVRCNGYRQHHLIDAAGLKSLDLARNRRRLARKCKTGNDLVRDQAREVGLREPVLAKIVGLLDRCRDPPGEIVDLARNIAQDRSRDIELHRLMARMTRGPYGDLDAAFLARRNPLTLAHHADRLANELRRDAVHQD